MAPWKFSGVSGRGGGVGVRVAANAWEQSLPAPLARLEWFSVPSEEHHYLEKT